MRLFLFAITLTFSGAIVANEKPVRVPSDSTAQYSITEAKINGKRVVISKREGKSGISYTSREIRCSPMGFRYIAEGDTYEEVLKDTKIRINKREPFSDVVINSISFFIVRKACRGF